MRFGSYDPIGIAHSRDQVSNEYDEVIRGLLVLRKQGADEVRMEEWVHRFFNSVWGIDFSVDASQELVHTVLRALGQGL
jgi:hypothetical protein